MHCNECTASKKLVGKSFISVPLIEHNISLYVQLKRSQRDHGSRQVKIATNHPKNCRNRA